MQIFRKHRRALLIFIFLVVGVPMLFFGIPWDGSSMMPGQDIELARVGGVPIMVSEFRQNLSTAAQRQASDGKVPTYAELEAQGVAGEIFQQMLTSALIGSMEAERGFKVEQTFLEDRLKDDPTFRDDEGNFNAARFNAWVRANQRMDWSAIYDSIQEQLGRQIYLTAQLAAANRVLDADVQQDLLDNSTRIQMEYFRLEPPVTLSEEEIQAHYDENKESYRPPPYYTADFVAISLQPEGPSPKLAEVLEKAQAGEDFAALADTYSDLETGNGGDMGWVSEREIELDYRKPLFALGVGEVSDAVPGPNGFYVYKVEEERVNEETEQREVKARHIYVKVELSDSERADRELLANQLAEKVRETQDLRTAADELGLTVATVTGFNVETTEIDGIPRVDTFQFRRAIDEEAGREEPAYNVITGRENLYVAALDGEPTPAEVPPLSDVRTQVADDARAAKKGEETYREATAAFADRIRSEADTLDEVKEKFPELDVQIRETRPFTKSEYLFQDQIYLQTTEIYDALEDKEPNALAGPLTDFLGGTYFIALTNRVEPTDEERAGWDEEGRALRDRMLAMAQYELQMDFMADIQERKLPLANLSFDPAIYQAALGIDATGGTDAPLSDPISLEGAVEGSEPVPSDAAGDDAADDVSGDGSGDGTAETAETDASAS